MLNGQLKPAYNVQIAVENYFIVHSYISNDRTDYNTLIPVLEKHQKAFGSVLEEVTADSGFNDKEIDEMFAECDEENAREDKGGLYGEE